MYTCEISVWWDTSSSYYSSSDWFVLFMYDIGLFFCFGLYIAANLHHVKPLVSRIPHYVYISLDWCWLVILINYRRQGHISSVSHSSGLVACHSDKTSIIQVAWWLTSRLTSHGAAEPPKCIPSLFFEPFTRLVSHRAAEPQKCIPSSFYKPLSRLMSHWAAKPLQGIPISFLRPFTQTYILSWNS